MTASVFFPASLINEQLTPEWLRESRNISRDVVFALQEARLSQDFARSLKKEKASWSAKLLTAPEPLFYILLIKIMYALKPRGLLYNQYPYPLNQQGLAAKSSNFNIFFIVSYNN